MLRKAVVEGREIWHKAIQEAEKQVKVSGVFSTKNTDLARPTRSARHSSSVLLAVDISAAYKVVRYVLRNVQGE